MNKKILVLQQADYKAIDEVKKIFLTIEEIFGHHFELLNATNIQDNATEYDAILTDKIKDAAQEYYEALQLTHSITSVYIHRALQHISPLKSKYAEHVNFLIYNNIASNSYNVTLQKAQQHAAIRKNKLTVVDNNSQDNTQAPVDDLHTTLNNFLKKPAMYDVVVANANDAGLLINQAAGIAGMPSLLPEIYFGKKGAIIGCQEHARDAGNPFAAMLSAALWLESLDLKAECAIIKEAVRWTIQHGFVTKDVDTANSYAASAVGDLIADYIAGRIPGSEKGRNIELRKSTII